MSDKRVCFIGLGVMGLPMAVNLINAGYDVVGYNRSRKSVDAFVNSGGKGAESLSEAVEGASFVITMLPDSPDVEQVMLDDGAVFDSAKSGAIVIDMSSIAPGVTRSLAATAHARQIRLLDAPVSGGEAGAREGTLSIMVGGGRETFSVSEQLLMNLGSTVKYVGIAGSGQTVKAANQLLVAGTIQLVSEAMVFLEASGVDVEPAVSVLAGGLAGNRILDRKAKSMMSREFTPGFRAELHDKDLRIVTAAAREFGVVIPVGALVAQLMQSLVSNDEGMLDHTALLRGVERLSGLG